MAKPEMTHHDQFVTFDRSPSDWHDDARSRDAGHDEMQHGVYLWAATLPETRQSTRYGQNCLVELSGVFVERPFTLRGRIAAFADVAVLYLTPENNHQHWLIFEVKPRIWSVGAVIRQCRATEFAINQSLSRHASVSRSSGTHIVEVFPVVPSNDPKLSILRAMYHAQAWNLDDGTPA